MIDGVDTNNYEKASGSYGSLPHRIDRWGIERIYDAPGNPGKMKTELAKWLKSNKKPRAEFAIDIEISLSYVNQLCSGAKTPGRALIKRITEHTNGAVNFAHWPEPTED
jgi:hypothetical protein